MNDELERLRAAMDDALVRRDLAAYWSAKVRHETVYDRTLAAEAEAGIAEIREFLLDHLAQVDPTRYFAAEAARLRAIREARMEQDPADREWLRLHQRERERREAMEARAHDDASG